MIRTRTLLVAAVLCSTLAGRGALGQQAFTLDAGDQAAPAELLERLALRIDGVPVDIVALEEARDAWKTLVYIDLALTTPSSVSQLANSLSAALDALLGLGDLEIVVADPDARTILPPTRSPELAGAALDRLATSGEGVSALAERRRLFASEREIEISRARQQADLGAQGSAAQELDGLFEEMAAEALLDEARMRQNQIDEFVSFLAEREDARRERLRSEMEPAAGEDQEGGRRHLVILADGLATDPLAYYLELVPSAASLAVQAATMPSLRPIARTAAAYGFTMAPVAFVPNEDEGGPDVRSNDVTVGFTLRFGGARQGAVRPVEEELGLVVQPADWQPAAEMTGGAVLTSSSAIADWMTRLPNRLEARFELPDETAPAAELELFVIDSSASGRRRDSIQAPTVVPGAGSPTDVAEVRLRRAFEGELDSEFELGGGAAGVEVVASLRLESTTPERTVGRLSATIVPPDDLVAGSASNWRVSTGLHREDGAVVASHGRPFAPAGENYLSFERPVPLPAGTDSAIVLAEDLATGRWGYALVDFVDLVEQAAADSPPPSRMINLRPEDRYKQRGRVAFVADVLEPFTEDVRRVIFYLNGRRVAARNRAPFRARIDLGRGDRLGRVEAVAFDAEDREIDRHELLVNQPPHAFWVRITEPEAGPVAGPVEVAAELKLPRGSRLSELRFYVKERLAATLREAPFRSEVRVPVGDAENFLRVEAELTDGRIAEDVIFLNRPGLSDRIGVELVQLYVVATDRSGLPVRDLEAAEFAVFEDDRAQELESFRVAFDLPLTLGLAIDTSSSLFLRMPDVKRAAVSFLDSLEARRDRAFLVGFGTEPRLVRNITSDLNAVRGGIGSLRPRGRTAVWGALSLALDQLEGLRGRKALVVFYDGDDEDSDAAFRQSLAQARRAQVPVYLVLMNDEAARTDGRSFSTRTFVSKLERMAKAGGGRVYYVRHDEDLEPIFESISRELRSHYLLTYYPNEEPGGPNWRELSIQLERSGVVARTIEGREVR